MSSLQMAILTIGEWERSGICTVFLTADKCTAYFNSDNVYSRADLNKMADDCS